MPDETSPGGSRIFRHEARTDESVPEISGGDPDLIEAIDRHLDACFGPTDSPVFHEIVSPFVHVDVHLVPPVDDFPFNRLVTSGMAERPMTVPDDFTESPFVELTIALPHDWPLSQEAFEDENAYWPIRLLKELARLPHEYETFLAYGHTIPNGDPPERYADGTDLCCALVGPPLLVPEAFASFEVADGREVAILGVVPIFEDEMHLKLAKGADALYDLFDEHGVSDVVDPARPSVVRKRRGFFRR